MSKRRYFFSGTDAAFAGAGATAGYFYSKNRRSTGRNIPRENFRVNKKKRKANFLNVGNKKQRTQSETTGMNQLTRSKKYYKYQPYRLSKHLYPSTSVVEDRFQGLTNFDTNSGYRRCSQFYSTGGAIQWLPIQIMDLTSFYSGGAGPDVMRTMGWSDRSTTGVLVQNSVYGQGPTGAGSTGTKTWTVTDTPTTSIGATPRVFLKWIKMSFNLYGARNRTTTFTLRIVRFKQFNQNFWLNLSTAEARELVQYLERPLLFNNLQTGTTEVMKKLAIIKTYTWTIQPMTKDSLNETTGNIKEAKVFLRMNKCFNLHWPDEGTHEAHAIPAGENNDGIDYETRLGTHKEGPNYGSRVYAILTAFSPINKELPAVGTNPTLTPSESFAASGSGGTLVDAAVEPSFDFLIRRGYCVEPN